MVDLWLTLGDNSLMETNKTFSITEALKFGWETFKKKPLFWIVAGLVTASGSSSSSYSDRNGAGNTMSNPFEQYDANTIIMFVLAALVVGLILGFIFLALEMGAYKAAIQAVENVQPKWAILASEFDFNRVFTYFLLLFRYGLIVLGGLLLFIVPGIYWAIKYAFAPYFYIEKNLSISESFRLSAQVTEGVKLKLIGFGVVVWVMMLVGALALFVGLLIVLPVTMLAGVYIYKKLSAGLEMNSPNVSQAGPRFEADPVIPAEPLV